MVTKFTTGRTLSSIGKVGKIFLLAKWGLLLFLFGVVFANSIVLSIQEKSVMPFIDEVGGRVIFVFEKLDTDLDAIINNQGSYDSSKGFFNSLWTGFITYSSILSDIIIAWYWIKLFSFMWSASPMSNDSETFKNIAAGIMITMILQMMLTLSYAAVTQDVNGFTGEDSVTEHLMTPWLIFPKFIKTLPYLASPIIELGDTLTGVKLSDNHTIQDNHTISYNYTELSSNGENYDFDV